MKEMYDGPSPHRFGIVVPVPATVEAQLAAVRKRFLSTRIHIAAHVTVVYPFTLSGEESRLWQTIGAVCDGVSSFDTSLGEVGAFADAGVIFVTINDGGQLRHLHLGLVAALGLRTGRDTGFRDFEGEHYLPHITLAADLSPARFTDAWSELNGHRFEGRLRVTTVCLHRQVGERQWEHLQCFDLRGLGGAPGRPEGDTLCSDQPIADREAQK